MMEIDYSNLDVRSSLDTSDKSGKSGSDILQDNKDNNINIDIDIDLNKRLVEGHDLTQLLDNARFSDSNDVESETGHGGVDWNGDGGQVEGDDGQKGDKDGGEYNYDHNDKYDIISENIILRDRSDDSNNKVYGNSYNMSKIIFRNDNDNDSGLKE